MSERDTIEMARSVLKDYQTTLNLICAMSLYKKGSEGYSRTRDLARSGLQKIKGSKQERFFAKDIFQCEISEDELSSFEKFIINFDKNEFHDEEKIVEIRERALEIATASDLKRYIS